MLAVRIVMRVILIMIKTKCFLDFCQRGELLAERKTEIRERIPHSRMDFTEYSELLTLAWNQRP